MLGEVTRKPVPKIERRWFYKQKILNLIIASNGFRNKKSKKPEIYMESLTMPLSNDWNKKSVCKCETTISTVGFTN
jgi:hypothetical protein